MQVREVGRFCASCIIVTSREIMSLTGKAFWLACWRGGGEESHDGCPGPDHPDLGRISWECNLNWVKFLTREIVQF